MTHQHVAGTNVCLHNRTFSYVMQGKLSLRGKLSLQAKLPLLDVPAKCPLVCANLKRLAPLNYVRKRYQLIDKLNKNK